MNDLQGGDKGLVGGGIGTYADRITDSYYLLAGVVSTTPRAAKTAQGQRYSELRGVPRYFHIYENWNVDLDNADNDNDPTTGGDDPWDFRNSMQYPALRAVGGAQDRRPKPTYLTVNLSASPGTLAENAGRTTVTITASVVGGPAPGDPVACAGPTPPAGCGINLTVGIDERLNYITHLFAQNTNRVNQDGTISHAKDYTVTAIPAITIPAGERSASATFTITPVNDRDGTEGTEQIVIRGDGNRGIIIHPEVRMYLTGPYAPPTARAVTYYTGSPDPAPENTRVFLEGRSSTPYGNIASYLWEQTSGTPVALSRATSDRAAFTTPTGLTADATYEFRLTVTDKGGRTDMDTVTVTVTAAGSTGAGGDSGPDSSEPPEQQATVSPTANAGPDLTGAPGESVTLQGITSINPHGEWWEMGHQWTQLSGPTVTLTHPQTSLHNQAADKFGDPRFTLPADAADGATLEFQLTVTDQEGESDSDTVTVTVIRPDNTPPVVAELALVRVFAGETVQITGQATDAEDAADALSYLWEQTGGTPTATLEGANSSVLSFTAPAVSGETALTFRLIVTDSGGLTASRKTTVTVLPTPTACAGDDLTSTAGASITLEGICSTNPYGEWWRMAHQWTQLAGPSVTLTHPQAERYNQAADKFGDPRFTLPADAADGTTLEFQLTVTDKEGGSDTDTVTVTVTSEDGDSG